MDEAERMRRHLLDREAAIPRDAAAAAAGHDDVWSRPEHLEYFMGIALAVRERANCLGRKVGAVLAVKDRVVATGYNGTPMGMDNCDEGGCHRCAHPEEYESGQGYDVCICVHAEQNAPLSAARFGVPVEGAVIYTTLRPCFGCTKELLQAKVEAVYYLHDWTHPQDELQAEYRVLQSRFDRIDQVVIPDSREEWARGRAGAATTDTGHAAGGS